MTGQPNLDTKLEQLRLLGLTESEYLNTADIVHSSYSSVTLKEKENIADKAKFMKFSNNGVNFNTRQVVPCAITYNISSGDHHNYNLVSLDDKSGPLLGYTPVNSMYFMNNSFNFGSTELYPEGEVPESTKSSRKNTFTGSLEEFKMSAKNQKNMPLSNKINLLKKVLDGIKDDTQVLISSKPKNKSQKIRKSNRHSKFRGVSLNGKKWQVMIMGSIKKKYFGGIDTEREAAVFYDKLSILTNGLAAKTNFNYTKSDLQRIMSELEYMEPIISN